MAGQGSIAAVQVPRSRETSGLLLLGIAAAGAASVLVPQLSAKLPHHVVTTVAAPPAAVPARRTPPPEPRPVMVPSGGLVGEMITASLPPVKVVATAPVKAAAPPPIPLPPPITLVVPHDVPTLDGATFMVDAVTYRLAGVKATAADAICATRDGAPWACGSRARVALRRAIVDQTLACRQAPGTTEEMAMVTCEIDGRPLTVDTVQP